MSNFFTNKLTSHCNFMKFKQYVINFLILDRTWLKHFLIGRKNNLQRTKKVIESYFTVRVEIPELFDDMTSDAEWIQKAVKVG